MTLGLEEITREEAQILRDEGKKLRIELPLVDENSWVDRLSNRTTWIPSLLYFGLIDKMGKWVKTRRLKQFEKKVREIADEYGATAIYRVKENTNAGETQAVPRRVEFYRE